MVLRDTPSAAAKVRVGGNESPGRRRPSTIAFFNCRYRERDRFRDLRGGSSIGSSRIGALEKAKSGPFRGLRPGLFCPKDAAPIRLAASEGKRTCALRAG